MRQVNLNEIRQDPQLTLLLTPVEVIVEPRFRSDLGDLFPLIESIAKVGLLHPIVITRNKRLVAGERRLEAWKILKPGKKIAYTEIPEYIADAEIEENTVRQNFTASELAAIYKHYQPQIEKQAKERMLSGTENPKENFLRVGQTRDIIGNIAGVSGKTLEKAVKIVEAAQTDPVGNPHGNYGKFPELTTSDIIGNLAGVSGKTLEKAVKITEIRQDPQLTLLLTPVEDLSCPVCGAPRVNELHCLGCGELFDADLIALKEAEQ